MMDSHIKEILRKDVEERGLLAKALKRVKRRQVAMIIIGVAIFFMFLLNYIKINKQIEKQDAIIVSVADALSQGAELINQNSRLIKTQDSVIKTLTNQYEFLKK